MRYWSSWGAYLLLAWPIANASYRLVAPSNGEYSVMERANGEYSQFERICYWSRTALWIVLGVAYMITGVGVYLIFFLFCTSTEQRTSPSKTIHIYLLSDSLFNHRL